MYETDRKRVRADERRSPKIGSESYQGLTKERVAEGERSAKEK